MSKNFKIKSTNTILYCQKWEETVKFYQNTLKLTPSYTSDWFVEFQAAEGAYLSVADERRATIKSNQGAGITLTFRVADADMIWHQLHEQGLELEPVKMHSWGARVFYFFDPEGHRLEIWSAES